MRLLQPTLVISAEVARMCRTGELKQAAVRNIGRDQEQGPTESNVALADVTGVYWRHAHIAANSQLKSCHPDLNHVQLAEIHWGELFSIGSQRHACSSSSATQVQNTIEIASLTPVFLTLDS